MVTELLSSRVSTGRAMGEGTTCWTRRSIRNDLLPQMIGGSSFKAPGGCEVPPPLFFSVKEYKDARELFLSCNGWGQEGLFWKVSDRIMKGVFNSSPVGLVEVTHESSNGSLEHLYWPDDYSPRDQS